MNASERREFMARDPSTSLRAGSECRVHAPAPVSSPGGTADSSRRRLRDGKNSSMASKPGVETPGYLHHVATRRVSRSTGASHATESWAPGELASPCFAMPLSSVARLIEAKLATVRADVRCSGDYKKMKEFLEDNLVCGTDRRVGVAQLVHVHDKITARLHRLFPTLGTAPWFDTELHVWLRRVHGGCRPHASAARRF